MTVRAVLPALSLALGACIMPPSDAGETLGTEGSATGGSTAPSDTGTSNESNSGPADTGDTTGTADTTGTTGEPACPPGVPTSGCINPLDVLIVVDNSSSMAEPQRALLRAVPTLVDRLNMLTDNDGLTLALDVQVMVTTTDMGSPLCEPFQPEGYEPAQGRPVATACTERLQDFTAISGASSVPEVCTDFCPTPVVPTADFVRFGSQGSNVPEVPEVDIDGDGTPDPPEAQALACLVPQGINGCGYESPLEAMMQALNPEAPHNTGPEPFLRPDAMLSIILMTDEADCSVQSPAVLLDPANQNVSPDTGMPMATSAACWNAGTDCVGPDGNGIYASCASTEDPDFWGVERYTNYLVEELRNTQGKEVTMVQLVGIPPVIAHSSDPPFAPVSGGVDNLIYRGWVDFPYPNGDILPDEWSAGVRAEDKEFEFGIGPGCLGQTIEGEFTTQAIPPVRMLEVCQSLDIDGTQDGVRCCMESICDNDYHAAMTCLAGMLIPVWTPF